MPEVFSGEAAVLDAQLQNPAVHIVAHLSRSPIPADEGQIALADIAECNFPGYAPIRLVNWAVTPGDDDGYAYAVSEEITWESSVIVTPQEATFCYLTTVAGEGPIQLISIMKAEEKIVFDKEGRKFSCSFTLTSFNNELA